MTYRHKKNKLYSFLPLVIFILLACFLFRGLYLHPEKIPSPLVNQPSPRFSLPELMAPNQSITEAIFLGHITLLNIWTSECSACQAEHGLLMQIAQDPRFNLIGLNYRDDLIKAEQWLRRSGNPYRWIITDQTGKTAIDWGVYGTPETFVIDQKGVIRYRHIGAITEEQWHDHLEPLINQLMKTL